MGLPSVIGVYSPAPQSGKSTLASILIEEYGYVPLKFSAPVKAMTAGLLHDLGMGKEVIERCLEGDLKESLLDEDMLGELSPRKIMQTIGTEWGRNTINKDLWTLIMSSKLKNALSKEIKVVIDDMRFVNEMDLIESINGSATIQLIREGALNNSGHMSEGLLDKRSFTRRLDNSGDLFQYRQAIKDMMNSFN